MTLIHRTFEIGEQRAAEDGIAVSLSSELPVPRYDGIEILDHSAAAVDMSRAKLGLPLLLDHDTTRLVGRIEGVSIRDQKLRGTLRFSASAAGQEVRRDVIDGIRKEMSIGYQVVERRPTRIGNELVNIVTRWTPYEGSFVAVPADETVGVGRSLTAAAEVETSAVAPERIEEPYTYTGLQRYVLPWDASPAQPRAMKLKVVMGVGGPILVPDEGL